MSKEITNYGDPVISTLINQQFHAKQQEILQFYFKHNPKILVLFGSVRAGKTYVMIVLFLMMVAMNKNKKKMYLIAGNTKASIFRNVISDLEKILNRQIKLDRKSCFQLFGNDILVLDGGMKGTNLKLRGNTLSGALLNEGTTLYPEFIQETQNRISDDSENNGWLFCDTNPDSLQSYVYKNLVLNDESVLPSGRLAIKCFKVTIFDNPYLSNDYIQNLIRSTPNGHMMERMINGEWCNSSGMIFKDLNPDKHYITDPVKAGHYKTMEDFYNDIDYFIGSNDFGWEHYNVGLIGVKTYSGTYYIIESNQTRRTQFDSNAEFFVNGYKKYRKKFDIYCDHARPDGMAAFESFDLYVEKANKSVFEGIVVVSSMLKQDKLFIFKSALGEIGETQMSEYSWEESGDGSVKDAPKKKNDDFPDALRYLVYSDYINNIDGNIMIAGSHNFM